MATIERTVQIVTVGPVIDRGDDPAAGPVTVHLRIGTTLVPTGITAPDTETAVKLVAAKLGGTA